MRVSKLFAAALAVSMPGAVLVAAPALPAPESVDSIKTTVVDGRITIDQHGALVDYRPETSLPASLESVLDQHIRSWKFEPVFVNGKPVVADTRMRVTLAAREDGDNYRVKVDNVTFPRDKGSAVKPDSAEAVTISGKRLHPPSYPEGLLRAGVNGVVLLYIRVAADGSVAEVMPVQTSLLNVKGRERVLAKAVSMFEQSAARTAKSWRFNVQMHTGQSTPADMTVSVPVTYRMDGSREARPGQWRTEVRGPRREASWLKDGPASQQIGVSDIMHGEIVPIASVFKLRTDVSGAAL